MIVSALGHHILYNFFVSQWKIYLILCSRVISGNARDSVGQQLVNALASLPLIFAFHLGTAGYLISTATSTTSPLQKGRLYLDPILAKLKRKPLVAQKEVGEHSKGIWDNVGCPESDAPPSPAKFSIQRKCKEGGRFSVFFSLYNER